MNKKTKKTKKIKNLSEKKINTWIIITIVVGVLVLYSFPKPSQNFLIYLATMLFFIIVVFYLYRKKRNQF